MNIFVSDLDPYKSARYLDDKRVVKMVLETAQLLSAALNLSGYEAPYKSTHINHPCSIWARATRANYVWLLHHFHALCAEYTLRFGKIHKCQNFQFDFTDGTSAIPEGDLIKHPNCTTYKHIDNTVEAYKLYLNDKWKNDKRKPTWHGQTRSEYA